MGLVGWPVVGGGISGSEADGYVSVLTVGDDEISPCRIREALSGHRVSAELLDSLVVFYGTALTFKWNDGHGGKCHISAKPPGAEIRVPLGSPRVAASLTHEMLHVALPAKGYCIVEAVFTGSQEAVDSNRWLVKMLNVVEHSMILGDFTSAGFTKDQFLGEVRKVTDISKAIRLTADELSAGRSADALASIWKAEYLKSTIGAGQRFVAVDEPVAFREHGKLLFPSLGFDESCAQIAEWCRTAKTDNPAAFADSISRLMRIVGWTQFRLVRVNRSQDGQLSRHEFQ